MDQVNKKKILLGSVFVLMAGLLWGCMGLYVRYMTELGLGSMQIVAARVIVTAIVMFVGLGIFNRKLLKIKVKDVWIFVCTGILSVVLFSFFYFTTINLTSLSVAAVLLYTSPIIVIFMSAVVFKEKLTSRKLIACATAFIGCVLVTGVLENGGALSLEGLLCGLAAAAGYALYSIMSRVAINRGYHSMTVIAYTFLFASIGVIPFTQWGELGTYLSAGGMNIPFLLFMAVMTSVLPYCLFTFGLTYIEPGKASIMASVEPVVATIVGLLVYNETLSLLAVGGIVLVLAAIVLLNLPSKVTKS